MMQETCGHQNEGVPCAKGVLWGGYGVHTLLPKVHFGFARVDRN
jgi:hypothetical protein